MNMLKNLSEIRERLELRTKTDEPTLKKYRCFFGIHVRLAAEVIAFAGALVNGFLFTSEFHRHRFISGGVSLVSMLCYISLLLGINANRGWAHWPYFFLNPICVLLQIFVMFVQHSNATPPLDAHPDDHSDHFFNLVSLILFIGLVLLLHIYCMLIVYRSYEYMLDYLRKQAHMAYNGEEMTDVIRQPADAVDLDDGMV